MQNISSREFGGQYVVPEIKVIAREVSNLEYCHNNPEYLSFENFNDS